MTEGTCRRAVRGLAASLAGGCRPGRLAGLVEDRARYSRGGAAGTTTVEQVTGRAAKTLASSARDDAASS